MMSSESMAAFAAAAEQPDQDDTRRPAQGIVFTTASVQAIGAGDKTQTRRVVSPRSVRPSWTRKTWPQLDLKTSWVDPGPSPAGNPGPYLKVKRFEDDLMRLANEYTVVRLYPRYFVGDLLYVKETWGSPMADHPRVKDGRRPQPGDRLVYAANEADAYQWDTSNPSVSASFGWRSSMLMPRWAARMWLEVTRVRIEQLSNISELDAYAEGVGNKTPCWKHRHDSDHHCRDGRDEYAIQWDALHTAPGTTWADDPLVIVYDFKRVNANGSPLT
jgi:uncharacterized protein YhfF